MYAENWFYDCFCWTILVSINYICLSSPLTMPLLSSFHFQQKIYYISDNVLNLSSSDLYRSLRLVFSSFYFSQVIFCQEFPILYKCMTCCVVIFENIVLSFFNARSQLIIIIMVFRDSIKKLFIRGLPLL